EGVGGRGRGEGDPKGIPGRRLLVARPAGMIVALGVTSAPTRLRRLTALAARCRRKRPILGEAAVLRLHGPTAFAAGFGRERTILRKAALLMRHIGTALAGNFALLVLLHAGETAQRSATLALVLLSHAVTSCLALMRPETPKSTHWQRLGFPHSRVQGAAVWQGRTQAVPLHRRLAHVLAHVLARDWPGIGQGLARDWPGIGMGPGDGKGMGRGLGQ